MESEIFERDFGYSDEWWNEDVRALVHLYNKFHEDLPIYAFFMVQDPDAALEVVKTLFQNIWENRCQVRIAAIAYKGLLVEIRKLCLLQSQAESTQ